MATVARAPIASRASCSAGRWPTRSACSTRPPSMTRDPARDPAALHKLAAELRTAAGVLDALAVMYANAEDEARRRTVRPLDPDTRRHPSAGPREE